MIFTAGSWVVGDNGTAYETLVQKFERTPAISAANVIVNIFCLFICELIIYVAIIYRMYRPYSLCA